eukprot:230887-Chlamydomonas_euryale.AAC.1
MSAPTRAHRDYNRPTNPGADPGRGRHMRRGAAGRLRDGNVSLWRGRAPFGRQRRGRHGGAGSHQAHHAPVHAHPRRAAVQRHRGHHDSAFCVSGRSVPAQTPPT